MMFKDPVFTRLHYPTEDEASRFISREIDTVGNKAKQLLFREFIQNAAEANSNKIHIGIEPDHNGQDRLTIWNNGEGFEPSKFNDFLQCFGRTHRSVNVNHGIGARLIGLAVSPAGMIVDTCRNGTVLRGRIEKRDEVYGAEPFSNVSAEFAADIRSHDWTRTQFVGVTPTSTPKEVIGSIVNITDLDNSESFRVGGIAESVMHRYFRKPHGLRIFIDNELSLMRQGTGNAAARELGDMLSFITLNDGRVNPPEIAPTYECVVSGDLKIHYSMFPKRSFDTDSGSTRLGRLVYNVEFNQAAGGVVLDNEILRLVKNNARRGNNAWLSFANSARFGTVARRTFVFVEVVGNLRDRIVWANDRTSANWKNGREVTLEFFAKEVALNLPNFITAEIAKEHLENQRQASYTRYLIDMMHRLGFRPRSKIASKDGEEIGGGNVVVDIERNNTNAITRGKRNPVDGGSESNKPASYRKSLPLPKIFVYFDPNAEDYLSKPWRNAGSRHSPVCLTHNALYAGEGIVTEIEIHVDCTKKNNRYVEDLYNEMYTRFFCEGPPRPGWCKTDLDRAMKENAMSFDTVYENAVCNFMQRYIGGNILYELAAARDYAANEADYVRMLVSNPAMCAKHMISATDSKISNINAAIWKEIASCYNGRTTSNSDAIYE
jgi:hypothetical protein